MNDFFSSETQVDEQYKEPETTTLIDIISILTEHKCISDIIDNSGCFWAMYEHKKAAGKDIIYKNLKRIFLSPENLPSTELNENGEGYAIKEMKLKLISPRVVIRYLSYNKETMSAAYKANVISGLDDVTVYKTLEKLLPKKKVYIRNLRQKKEIDPEHLETVRDFFQVSKRKAEEYIDIVDQCGRLDEFLAIFGVTNE